MTTRFIFVTLLLALFIRAHGAVIFSDAFDYASGPLVTVSAGNWNTHSGTTGEIVVESGRALISQNLSEDVNASFGVQSTAAIYASFTINLTNLPSASGEYFAHFKNSSTGFRGKIFAMRQGASPGFYRLGLANLSNTPNAILNYDLALNTDYTVLMRCVLSNAQCSLWVNPSSENDFAITDTNATSSLAISSFALRESSGLGNLFIDDVLIGTTFDDVLSLRPPTIISQPNNQTVTEGGATTLSVEAVGTGPLSFQWQFNGAILSGATNSALILTNITPVQAGVYLATVSNVAGATNSEPVVITVNSVNPSSSHAAFSLVHYNVKGNFASDWTTNAPQVQAIARQLIYLNPDVITLNEIPNSLRSEMTNWMKAFFPDYNLAISSGTDGAIRSGVISRFAITRTNSWLDGVSLTNFGYDGTFTRDLFEAEISVPNFDYPLHVFTSHLKSGQDTDSSSRRAAEARAISNYFVTSFLTTNSAHPYLLTGDFNEDIARPPASNPQSIQTLISTPTGLRLTTPLNLISGSELTHSIQNTNGGLSHRYDYILPSQNLFPYVLNSEVFRTDLLTTPTPPLRTNDDIVASDHLPVLMVFENPFHFEFTKILVWSEDTGYVSLTWQSIPGHSYALQSSFDFTNWTTFATNLTSTSNTLTFTTNIVADKIFIRSYRDP